MIARPPCSAASLPDRPPSRVAWLLTYPPTHKTKVAGRYHIVTLEAVSGEMQREENPFLQKLGDALIDPACARRLLSIPSEAEVHLKLTCTSELYYQSGNISAPILMVLAHTGLIKISELKQVSSCAGGGAELCIFFSLFLSVR